MTGWNKRCIQNPTKHLQGAFLQKQVTDESNIESEFAFASYLSMKNLSLITIKDSLDLLVRKLDLKNEKK